MLSYLLLATAAAAAAAPSRFSQFRLASSFSEHAVLQRAPASARVWGWTRPQSAVSAHLNCSAAGGSAWSGTVQSDDTGLWVVEYPPQNATLGAPCYSSFTDADSNSSVWFLDVKFGEVLLCMGREFCRPFSFPLIPAGWFPLTTLRAHTHF